MRRGRPSVAHRRVTSNGALAVGEQDTSGRRARRWRVTSMVPSRVGSGALAVGNKIGGAQGRRVGWYIEQEGGNRIRDGWERDRGVPVAWAAGRAGVPVATIWVPSCDDEDAVCFSFFQFLATKRCCRLSNIQLFSPFL